jgi:hypothetical protein
MPAIKVLNNKQELFCRFVARGETYTKAYELAGYAPSTSNASGLANRPDIADRIKCLREEYLREEAMFEATLANARRADRESGDPDQPATRQASQWTFDRVMDMIAENVRLAQIATQFGAANDALKMLGDAMSMFDKAEKAKVPPSNPLALIGRVVQSLPGAGDDDDAPAPPRNPLAPAGAE